MPNGEKHYIFGKTDAGYAIADTFGHCGKHSFHFFVRCIGSKMLLL